MIKCKACVNNLNECTICADNRISEPNCTSCVTGYFENPNNSNICEECNLVRCLTCSTDKDTCDTCAENRES